EADAEQEAKDLHPASSPMGVGGGDAEDRDRERSLRSRRDEQRPGEAEPPGTRGARPLPAARILLELLPSDEADRPCREEERDLHPAPERPRERADAEKDRRQQIRREAAPVVTATLDEETTRREEGTEDAHRRDDRRPLHQVASDEPEEPSER